MGAQQALSGIFVFDTLPESYVGANISNDQLHNQSVTDSIS